MILFLHKKFLKPAFEGFVRGGFVGAAVAGIGALTGKKQRPVARTLESQLRPGQTVSRTFGSMGLISQGIVPRRAPTPRRGVADRTFTSFQAATADARRRRAPQSIRPPTPVSFGGPFVSRARQTFDPFGRDLIIQLVRRFCR